MVTADVATYDRLSARGAPTLIEGFIDATAGDAAGTPLVAGASVVSPPDVGIINGIIDKGPWEGLGVSAEDASFVVPAGAGAETGEITPQDVLVMLPATAFPGSQWIPGSDWFPGSQWIPGSDWFPGSQWIPGTEWMPDEARSLETYLTSGQESRPELFGQESLPGASLEADEEVSLENAVLAAPADLFFPGSQWNPKEFHSAGTPAPLGGRTFGVSVASFPGSQWVMNEDLFSLLGREFTNDMLYSAMGGGGEGVELGLEPANLAPGSATMLGTETEIRSFVGSVDGPTVPHGVGIHAARVETEEVVVLAVGAHNWPSGVAGQPTYSNDVAERARAYFAAVLERLDYEVDVTATTPTPTAPGSDRRSDTVPIPPMTLSKAKSVDVQEQSRFAIEFEALTECPMDVFVIPAEPFRTFVDSGDERRPDEIRDGHESLAREHSPEELRFFGEATGRGTAELSAGTHFVVFTRTCELGTRTAVEFTAEIEAGSF